MRRRRWLVAVGVATALAAVVVVGVNALLRHVDVVAPGCSLGSGPDALFLATDQAQNATTISAVAGRLGLPDHAVTVALATALQESKLHNLPYGDRDSVGLFQQRPSQGWGRRDQLLTPAYAAAAFYEHLSAVPGWQALPVTEAAQSVQHSADGSGYAQWEEEARALARALTGEVAAGLTCRFDRSAAPAPAGLRAAAARELGSGVLDSSGSAARDWAVAQWLVGHAFTYGIDRVTVRQRIWTSRSGTWTASAVGGPPSYHFARTRA
jgi:hypothetical protein